VASLEADTVATLVVDMLNDGHGWSGTAKDLLVQLNNRASDQQKRDKHWPKTPRGMTGRLRRASEILREQGWAVEFTRATLADRARIITIVPADKSVQQSSKPSNRPKPSKSNGLGADGRSDGLDGPSAIVRRPSTDSPFIRLGFGRLDGSDGSNPHLSADSCAYCGRSDPAPQVHTLQNSEVVHLHLDCEEYWTREHEADDVSPGGRG